MFHHIHVTALLNIDLNATKTNIDRLIDWLNSVLCLIDNIMAEQFEKLRGKGHFHALKEKLVHDTYME